LRGAAGFFIEQVLLHPGGGSYRILGGDRDTSARELRRNMALLMRWLHPDVTSNGSSENDVYRSTFANRITVAWEAIKTEERRAAYDRSVAAKNIGSGGVTHRNGVTEGTTTSWQIRAGRGSHPARQLVMKQVESESFWSRLRLFLGRYR
jgi:DnaJ-class molecular chaperone